MSDLLQRMLKAGSIKSVTLDESALFNDKDQSPTEIPIINLALGGKLKSGLISGLTFLAGPSKHFKSLLGLVLVKAYMKKYKDSICIFYDSEFGITPDYIKSNGLDPSRIVHVPIEHLEHLKFDIAKRLDEIKRGDKVIFFIDSVGNLASKKEAEDALNGNAAADMTRAKVMKSLWRIVTPHLTTKDIPCIAVNHTYQTMEMFSKAIMSGGCLEAGTMIQMSDGTVKSIEDILDGDSVKTLLGNKSVSATWDPETLEIGEPECYEIEFDDSYKVVCSDKHRFLSEDMNWIEAKDLLPETKLISNS